MMTAKKRELAAKLMAENEMESESGNQVYRNCFYRVAGMLYNIQYKNGKMYDVICYGK